MVALYVLSAGGKVGQCVLAVLTTMLVTFVSVTGLDRKICPVVGFRKKYPESGRLVRRLYCTLSCTKKRNKLNLDSYVVGNIIDNCLVKSHRFHWYHTYQVLIGGRHSDDQGTCRSIVHNGFLVRGSLEHRVKQIPSDRNADQSCCRLTDHILASSFQLQLKAKTEQVRLGYLKHETDWHSYCGTTVERFGGRSGN